MISDYVGPTVIIKPPGVDESVWHCQGCNCGGETIKLTTEWAIRSRRSGQVWKRTEDRAFARREAETQAVTGPTFANDHAVEHDCADPDCPDAEVPLPGRGRSVLS